MARGRKPKESKQLQIYLPENTRHDIVATSKAFLRGELDSSDVLGWTLIQQKLFILMLAQIDWRNLDRPLEQEKDLIVEINNAQAMQMLGWSGRLNNFTNVMQEEFHQMMTHSCIMVQDPYTGKWFNDNFIVRSWGDKQNTYVQLAAPILSHFMRLYDLPTKGAFCKSFVTLIQQGCFESDSRISYAITLKLQDSVNRKALISSCLLTVDEIKKLCNLPPNAYMKDLDPETGIYKRFDRTYFEDKILNRFIKDSNKNESLKLFQLPDGLYYKRHYANNRVYAYEFFYRILDEHEIELNRSNILLAIEENRHFEPKAPTSKERKYLDKILLGKDGKLTKEALRTQNK